MTTKKEEVLRQLKLVRKTKMLSYQDIAAGTEAMGTPVSLSSIRRVFAEDSMAEDFRYDTTLRPIVRYVLGIEGDAEEPQTLDEAQVRVAGLTAVVDYKDTMIEKLEGELARVRDDCQRQKDYLKKELEIARRERDEKEKTLRQYRGTTFLFLAFFVLALIMLVIYLVVDRANPEWGIFWKTAAASLSNAFTASTGGAAGKIVV